MTDKINNSNQEDSSQSQTGQNSSKGQNSEKRSLFSNLFSFMRTRNNSTLREDLTDALSEGEGEASSLFSPEERIMLNNILRLRETRVEDVMIPRSEIEALDITTTLAETLIEFEKSGHSRMPVYSESLDDPRGMLHIRDVLNYITREAQRDEKVGGLNFSKIDLSRSVGELDLIRTVLFVPGSMLASQLLTRMQATRTQMALIIDEYGGTDGLASMEDIVELVVGDIEDEHDDVDMSIIKEADNKWLVDASADLEEVGKALGSDFKVGEHGEDVDTIGGLIVSALDRIPAKGELVEAVPGYQFRILEADKRRIKRIRIQPLYHRQKNDGEKVSPGGA